MKTLLTWLWHPIRAVFLALTALVIAIEEWGWRPLTRWAAKLAQWPPIMRLEAQIRSASPRVALMLFLVPAVALFPVKLLALWLIGLGHGVVGLCIIISAKLVGTALVGRLFIITEPQLMQFAWFAHALGWWRSTKLKIKTALRESAVWQAAARLRRRASVWMRRMSRNAR